MEAPVIAYLLVALAPFAVHFSTMLGRLLLEPVRSGFSSFDRAYNRWPWLAPALCGLFAAAALRLQNTEPPLLWGSVGAAAFFFIADMIGCALSVTAYVCKRR